MMMMMMIIIIIIIMILIYEDFTLELQLMWNVKNKGDTSNTRATGTILK